MGEGELTSGSDCGSRQSLRQRGFAGVFQLLEAVASTGDRANERKESATYIDPVIRASPRKYPYLVRVVSRREEQDLIARNGKQEPNKICSCSSIPSLLPSLQCFFKLYYFVAMITFCECSDPGKPIENRDERKREEGERKPMF